MKRSLRIKCGLTVKELPRNEQGAICPACGAETVETNEGTDFCSECGWSSDGNHGKFAMILPFKPVFKEPRPETSATERLVCPECGLVQAAWSTSTSCIPCGDAGKQVSLVGLNELKWMARREKAKGNESKAVSYKKIVAKMRRLK